MDTTQSFGISAGAKTQSISGSMMFATTMTQTGTIASNNYVIFHISGTGDNVSSLTGVTINDSLNPNCFENAFSKRVTSVPAGYQRPSRRVAMAASISSPSKYGPAYITFDLDISPQCPL